MSTPAPPFTPTPFATPIVSPAVASFFRRVPYISPSEYKQAPTSVATNTLVPGGNPAANLAELANVIWRASDWVDTMCYHRADGTLAASPTTEQNWIKAKPDGSLILICSYKPILQVNALALGPVPSQMSDVTQDVANNIFIKRKTIQVPGAWQGSPQPFFSGFPTYRGGVYAIWEYVSGFPHTALTADATKGSSSIQVAPAVPAGAVLFGIYDGTQLTIHDGAATEVIVVTSVSGLTLNLAQPLQYDHTIPTTPTPDTVRVTAIPWAVEQATISLVSCLIKTRGTRAAVLPQTPGTPPPKQALADAGGLEDFEIAEKLLKPFTSVYLAQ
jgi:hypothetical protein